MAYITEPWKTKIEVPTEDRRYIEPFDFDKEYELMMQRMRKRINRIKKNNENK